MVRFFTLTGASALAKDTLLQQNFLAEKTSDIRNPIRPLYQVPVPASLTAKSLIRLSQCRYGARFFYRKSAIFGRAEEECTCFALQLVLMVRTF